MVPVGLFVLVALAVLEPAASFTGPNALLPLRARCRLRRVLSFYRICACLAARADALHS